MIDKKQPKKILLKKGRIIDPFSKKTFIGDILNSRVARSNIFGLRKLGAEVVVCGPTTLRLRWQVVLLKCVQCLTLTLLLILRNIFII